MQEMNAAWLGFLAVFVVTLCAMEFYGWHYYGVDGMLSAHVRRWTSLHPLLIFALGAAAWGLADHFWGHAAK